MNYKHIFLFFYVLLFLYAIYGWVYGEYWGMIACSQIGTFNDTGPDSFLKPRIACCFYNDWGRQECRLYDLGENVSKYKGEVYYQEKKWKTPVLNVSALNFSFN